MNEPIPLPESPTDVLEPPGALLPTEQPEAPLRKYYIDGGSVEIAAHVVYELDTNGKQLRMVKFTDYASENVRTLWTSAAELRARWSNAQERDSVIEELEKRGITLDQLADNVGQPEADPLDLLCYVAFSAPLRSRRERAERLLKGRKAFWDRFKPEARLILEQILNKYIEYGTAQFKVPDILKVAPISNYGNVLEIAAKFGGAEHLRSAIEKMQNLLYTEAA